MIGDIMGISRLRMGTDGEGVTTLVAFFGCPLNCKYCINDFCHEIEPQIIFTTPPRGAYTAEELVKILAKDEIYFRMSKGGITFGGGEPLQQAAFIKEVCSLSSSKWKKRIETSLYASWDNIALLTDSLDEWIIDIKEMNDDIYTKYTKKSNRKVISNLQKLLNVVPADKVRIRLPQIPGFNNKEDIERSILRLKQLGVVQIEIFEYVIIDSIRRERNDIK